MAGTNSSQTPTGPHLLQHEMSCFLLRTSFSSALPSHMFHFHSLCDTSVQNVFSQPLPWSLILVSKGSSIKLFFLCVCVGGGGGQSTMLSFKNLCSSEFSYSTVTCIIMVYSKPYFTKKFTLSQETILNNPGTKASHLSHLSNMYGVPGKMSRITGILSV